MIISCCLHIAESCAKDNSPEAITIKKSNVLFIKIILVKIEILKINFARENITAFSTPDKNTYYVILITTMRLTMRQLIPTLQNSIQSSVRLSKFMNL